jgi:hypothetical protein
MTRSWSPGERNCLYNGSADQVYDRARHGDRGSRTAVISYPHAHEMVRLHSESGITARLVPFTVDGLIWTREHAHP